MSKQNNNGDTVLWFASHEGRKSKVRCLLSLGVWPEIPGAPAELQPEAVVILEGHPKIAEILRQAIDARAEAGGNPPPSTESAARRRHTSDPIIGPAIVALQ